MKKSQTLALSAAIAAVASAQATGVLADAVADALTGGKAYGDFNLRYETVDQDNSLKDASALTLRSRLGYTTGTVEGFSATLEFEDSRIVAGEDEFSVGPTGFHPGEYSAINDPETTELDQGFVQYKNKSLTAKLGRQVITYDNHRFVGHVGWRQDRQTFDGVTLAFNPMENLTINYAYIDKRNRIFAEAADIDSEDHLFNAKLNTGIGSFTGYAYLLDADTAVKDTSDTYGLNYTGSTMAGDVKLLYSLEYANQEADKGANGYEADYMMAEAGAVISGITGKVGYEVLGSDGSAYGFSTPLATLHKFNGWADQFLGTPAVGLADLYFSVGGTLAGGGWTIVYHDFEADESTAAVDDLGDEVDLSYVKKFGKNYTAGVKYAAYSAGDVAAGKVDTDIFWFWLGASF